MLIMKASVKDNLGEFTVLSITKAEAKAKQNPQIFICDRFRADGILNTSPTLSCEASGLLLPFHRPPTREKTKNTQSETSIKLETPCGSQAGASMLLRKRQGHKEGSLEEREGSLEEGEGS